MNTELTMEDLEIALKQPVSIYSMRKADRADAAIMTWAQTNTDYTQAMEKGRDLRKARVQIRGR